MKVFTQVRALCADRPLFVLGHDTPDADTVLATGIFCRAARQAGIDARPVSTGIPDRESCAVVRKCGVETTAWPAAESLRPGDLLFLVDCRETPHPGTVVGCVDHHPTDAVPSYAVAVIERASSAALMIYRQAVREGIALPDDCELIALRSVYADTESLLSPKFLPSDRPFIDRTIAKYGLSEEELIRDGLCFSDLTLPPERLAVGGLKYHTLTDANGTSHPAASSHIEAEGVTDELIGRCLDVLADLRVREGKELWVLIVVEPLSHRSRVWELTDSGVGMTAFDRFISRSVDVLPALERKYRSIR